MADPTQIANEAAVSGPTSAKAMREVEILLSANTGPYQKEMKAAATVTTQMTNVLVAADTAYKNAIKAVGATMMGFGASAQAMAASGAWAAAQFEESFARVAKTTGLTNSLGKGAATFGLGGNTELQDFSEDIRRLSTEIPVGTAELAHLADVAGQLGVEGGKNLTLFSSTAAKLGAAINDLPSDVAVQGLSNLMGAFQRAPEDVTRLASSLAELANHTRGSANATLLFSDRLAGTAVQANMTAEEVLGLGAAVSAIGQGPERGASAVARFMTDITTAIQEGGNELDKWARAMGMTVEEVNRLWEEKGGLGLLDRFLRVLSTQGEEAVVVLQSVGQTGVAQSQVLGGLAAQYGEFTRAIGLSNEASRENVALNDLAKVRFDTVTKALERFRGSVMEIPRALGQGFLRPMKMAVDTASMMVNLFNKIPGPLKTVMGLILGLGGGVLVAAGAFTMFFAKFHAFFLLMSTAPMIIGKVTGALERLQALLAANEIITANQHLDFFIQKLNRLAATMTAVSRGEMTIFQAIKQGAMDSVRAMGQFMTTARAFVMERLVKLYASLKVTAQMMGVQFVEAVKQAGRAMLVLSGRLAAVTKWGIAATFREWTHALGLTTKALWMLNVPLGALMLPLGKILIVAGLVAGAAYGMYKAWQAGTGRLTEPTQDLYELARGAELAYERVDSLNDLLQSTGQADFKLAQEAKPLLDLLNRMSEGESEEYLQSYGLVLISQGNDPKEVREHIEELGRLSGNPLVFTYKFEDLTEASTVSSRMDLTGNIFDQWYDTLDPSGGKIKGGVLSWVKPFGNKLGEIERSTLDQLLDQARDIASQHPLASYSIFQDIADQFNEAVREGKMSDFAWREAREMLTDILPEGVDLVGDANTGSTLARHIAGLIGDESLQSSEPVKDVTQAIRDYLEVGERLTESQLADAVLALDEEALRGLIDSFGELAPTAIEALHTADIAGMEFAGNLHKSMEEGAKAFGRIEEDYERFRDSLFKSYPQDVGFVTAIQDASKYLDHLIDESGEWSEDVVKLREAMNQWTTEFTGIDMPADQAFETLRKLDKELRRLSNDPTVHDLVIQTRMDSRGMLVAKMESDFRALMGQYDQLVEQRNETVKQHNERLEEMQEDHNKRISKMGEQHAKSLGKMEEQKTKSIRDAHENHQKRLKDINKAEKKALEDRVEQQADAWSAIERIQAQPSAGIGAMLNNIEAQNRAMAEMARGVSELRKMGLSEDVMENLGFDDPKNFAQVRRMLEAAMSDPGMIDQINQAWGQRLDIAESFTKEADTSKIKEGFDEQRQAAKESLDEQLADINKRHREQVREANARHREQLVEANESHQEQIAKSGEQHAKQMQQIAENLAKLGEESFESIDELIEKASNSGLARLEEWADQIKEAQEGLKLKYGELSTGQQADARRLQAQADAYHRETWGPLKSKMAKDAKEANDGVVTEFGFGVDNSFDILERLTRQDGVWGPATNEAESGAGRMGDAVVEELDKRTDKIDRVVARWARAVQNNLNPVLDAVGAEPLDIRITPVGRSGPAASPGGGGVRKHAEGGIDHLPGQAVIQSAGTLVQWAEPETGGEAFIPLAPSKRDRSREIWKQTGELLGMETAMFAEGGIRVPDLSGFGTLGDATQRVMEHVFEKVMESAAASVDSVTPTGSMPTTALKKLALQKMVAMGWSESQWGALERLVQNESGWNPNAQNPTSTAYGLFQFLDSTWAGVGMRKTNDPGVQIDAGLKYIKNRYGSPGGALAFWLSRQPINGKDVGHWYAQGGLHGVDDIPALLSRGEFVMQPDAVNHYGPELMEALNAQKFAQGGLVGSMPRSRGREPMGPSGPDLVGALTKALENASPGRSETNNWDVTVQANDTRKMLAELEAKKRLKRLTGGDPDR